MRFPAKPGLKLFLSVLSFTVGLSSAIAIHQLFTGISLVETMLMCVAVIYVLSTWFSRNTISRYRDSGYTPRRSKRIWDDFCVNVAVFVIEPICISFMYAGLVLLICKWIAPDQLKRLANGVYDMYVFSKTYIRKPLATLIAILSVAVFLRVISHTVLKRIRKYTKWIGFPFQLAGTLLFFVQADHGLSNKYVSWKINEQMFEAENGQGTSFDSSTEDQAQVKEIIVYYVATMVERLDQDWHRYDSSSAAVNSSSFRDALVQLERSWEKDISIKEDLFAGLRGAIPSIGEDDQRHVDEILDNYAEVKARNDHFVASQLYDDAYLASPKSRKSIVEILTDGRTSIDERVKTPNQEVFIILPEIRTTGLVK